MSENIQSISQGTYTIGATSANDSSLLVTQNEGDVSILQTPQEVSHDNTLSGNGTVDSPLGVVPGYNETVLWSGTVFNPNGSNKPMNGTAYLSESIFNFDQIRLDFIGANNIFNESVLLTNPIKTAKDCYFNIKKEQKKNNVYIGTKYGFTDNTTLTGFCGYGNTQIVSEMTGGYWGFGGIARIVGINRKVQ